jgi:hypothetical protein
MSKKLPEVGWITTDGASVNGTTVREFENEINDADDGWTTQEHDILYVHLFTSKWPRSPALSDAWNIPFTLLQSTLLKLWHLHRPCPSERRSRQRWQRLGTMVNSTLMNSTKLSPQSMLGIKPTITMVMVTAMMAMAILRQETHSERLLHL